MSGHGHVTPNADRTTALCGGPAVCEVCAKEYFAKHGKIYSEGPAGPAGQASIVSEPEADEPDNGPGDVGEPSDFERRAAAVHMALRHREILGGDNLRGSGKASLGSLIADGKAIYAFLKNGESR